MHSIFFEYQLLRQWEDIFTHSSNNLVWIYVFYWCHILIAANQNELINVRENWNLVSGENFFIHLDNCLIIIPVWGELPVKAIFPIKFNFFLNSILPFLISLTESSNDEQERRTIVNQSNGSPMTETSPKRIKIRKKMSFYLIKNINQAVVHEINILSNFSTYTIILDYKEKPRIQAIVFSSLCQILNLPLKPNLVLSPTRRPVGP